ncbi:hypothetical protein VBD025_16985 [Virgibacillus flavescens]|uniref:hypothetical protein n=1 Tax=Virgibacillus flavescens TaxID=1611422 RepID=UPI003D344040
MGYILPITHYQYQDYQNRVTQKEQDPYHIEKPYKVILDTKSREMEDEDHTQKDDQSSKSNFFYKPMNTDNNKNEKVISKITGKGQHFSESI